MRCQSGARAGGSGPFLVSREPEGAACSGTSEWLDHYGS